MNTMLPSINVDSSLTMALNNIKRVRIYSEGIDAKYDKNLEKFFDVLSEGINYLNLQAVLFRYGKIYISFLISFYFFNKRKRCFLTGIVIYNCKRHERIVLDMRKKE